MTDSHQLDKERSFYLNHITDEINDWVKVIYKSQNEIATTELIHTQLQIALQTHFADFVSYFVTKNIQKKTWTILSKFIVVLFRTLDMFTCLLGTSLERRDNGQDLSSGRR
jgi:hypothetical protein